MIACSSFPIDSVASLVLLGETNANLSRNFRINGFQSSFRRSSFDRNAWLHSMLLAFEDF